MALSAGTVRGQDSAVAGFLAGVRVARRDMVADSGRLWGVRLDTIPWLGVWQGRMIRVGAGGDTTSVPVPAGMAAANTSVEWDGRRWAMVVLPVPRDSVVAARLLMHEAVHVLQPAVLPKPDYNETGAGSDLLDGPEGRVWLRLELRALAAALRDTGAVGRQARDDAVLFNEWRRLQVAAVTEAQRESALELVEGLPEYSGWRLSGATPEQVAAVLVAPEPRGQTYVRRFAYQLGPAYGFLLDRSGPGWRRGLSVNSDLAMMAAPRLAGIPDSAAVAAAAARYGVDSIRAQEAARAVARTRELNRLKAAFVTGPTLRIRPGVLRLTFDPRVQSSLGASGTVMGQLTWIGVDSAQLSAPDGALVVPDWTEVRVPLGKVRVAPGTLRARKSWVGDGWTLTLPAGWIVGRGDGGSVLVTPPAGSGHPG